jgi:putative tryptophan/tyrosine transport system substrate-binding protein
VSRRREFITFLGSAAAWPMAARAQKPPVPLIGLLYSASSDPNRIRGFRRGLQEQGYIEGENVTIEYRFAENEIAHLSVLATDLVRRGVSVVFAGNSISSLAAKAATTSTPIVFAIPEEPVSLGLVASLPRPGGNATGITFLNTEVIAKRLGLLREMVPSAARVAVLINPTNAPNTEAVLRSVDAAAGTLGLQTQVFKAGTSHEIDQSFAAFGRARIDALFVSNDGFFFSRRVQLGILSAKYSLPASYGTREIVEVGGLMSYGADIPDAWRQGGIYVGRILKGATSADLPVLQATKLELVINHQTARSLNLTVPPTLLTIADEVIE